MADMVLPHHVAIIMDGNGRWATRRLMPRAAGHRAGLKRMIPLAEHVFESGVKYCTLFALSAENLNRPQEELESLFQLFREYFAKQIHKLEQQGIRLRVIGNLALIPADIAALIAQGERETAKGKRGTLTLAIGYGARQDIVSACNSAMKEGREVTVETFAEMLSTGGMPAVDLLIRTGKEKRLSNFLLFEAAYAELYFSEKMFPDFTNKHFDRALAEYCKRDRRYGKI
ncbi:MAG: di-trans,poly-cis-decaprenylcistransferase [Clostridia bacterium]|nr:di-trans,poly-cis-decaprenylcistransferase [Clostridia bacterium]